MGDRCIDKLVEGHAIRLEAALLHLQHYTSRLLYIAICQMCFHECVEAHHINHASFFGLLHPIFCCHQIVAFDTCIEHSVVDDAVELNATLLQRVEDAHGSLKVLVCRALANHHD